MKTSRFQFEFRHNASKQHKLLGDILRNSEPWKGYKIYQEYPVNRINEKWKNSRAHFDWVIKDLKVVIEIHGEQHYYPVQFGGISPQEAKMEFIRRVNQDNAKKQAALEANYKYVTIKYDEIITSELLWKKLNAIS